MKKETKETIILIISCLLFGALIGSIFTLGGLADLKTDELKRTESLYGESIRHNNFLKEAVKEHIKDFKELEKEKDYYKEKVEEFRNIINNFKCECDYSKLNEIDQNIKMFIMDHVDIQKNYGVLNGIYYGDKDYYCVWSKNKTISEMEEVDRHEYCHGLVEEDYKHFCYKEV